MVRPNVSLVIMIAVFLFTSAVSGWWNKRILIGGVSPTFLTLVHLLVGGISDYCFYVKEEKKLKLIDFHKSIIPIALCVVLGKVLTYYSYIYVSISLAHTAKASEPLFSALLARFFGESVAEIHVLFCVQIFIGILLTSLSDFSYNHIGFIVAVLSALMKVLQNYFTMKSMNHYNSVVTVHLATGLCSILFILPALFYETHGSFIQMALNAPVIPLIVCSMLQWVSSLSFYFIIHSSSALTAAFVGVFKRILLIVGADVLDKEPKNVLNYIGILIATLGVSGFSFFSKGLPADQQIILKSVNFVNKWFPSSKVSTSLKSLMAAASKEAAVDSEVGSISFEEPDDFSSPFPVVDFAPSLPHRYS